MCEFIDSEGVPFLQVGHGMVGVTLQQIKEIASLDQPGTASAYLRRELWPSLNDDQRAVLREVDPERLSDAAREFLAGGDDDAH